MMLNRQSQANEMTDPLMNELPPTMNILIPPMNNLLPKQLVNDRLRRFPVMHTA